MDGLLDHADVVGQRLRREGEAESGETGASLAMPAAVIAKRPLRAPKRAAALPADGRAPPFPFSAIVAQEEMKRALLLAAGRWPMSSRLPLPTGGDGHHATLRAASGHPPRCVGRLPDNAPRSFSLQQSMRHSDVVADAMPRPSLRHSTWHAM